MNIRCGRIEDIIVYGDFMAAEPLTGLCEALRGLPRERQAVSDVLARFPIPVLFGGIHREEIQSLIMGDGS